MRRFTLGLACLALVCASPSLALETVKVTDGIYAFVGEKEQRSPQNLANNATFGLIVTSEGAVLVDPGGSFKGAAMLHAAVRKVTDQPVRYVVNTGGQDHRWLGNIEIHHKGQAHTPGDSFVWVPATKTVFTGDIVYVERSLGVMDFSSSRSWLEAFDALASLAPAHVVPGHGAPTTLARATADTYDYLSSLREKIGAHIEAGGDAIGAPKVDQSAFKHLEQFDALAGRNAQSVFAEMEFE